MNIHTTISTYWKNLRTFRVSTRLAPARDWHSMMLTTLILLVLSVAWNVWFFMNAVSEKPIASPTLEDTTPTTDAVDRVHTVFEERERARTLYETDYSFVDPAGE